METDRSHGWTVVDYVREEVIRQRHDVTQPEGIERVAWMLDAWCYACRLDGSKPTVEDAIKLGQIIEPDKNRLGLRTVGVGVRDSISGLMVKKFPDFDQVPRLLEILFEQRDQLEPIEFYAVRAGASIHRRQRAHWQGAFELA